MSLLSELHRTVFDAKIVDASDNVLAGALTTGSLVAASADLPVISNSTDAADVTTSAVTITGTVTNAASTLPPVTISGSGGLSNASVNVPSLGHSIATVSPGDTDYTVATDDQNGLFIYYDTALTAARTITLPVVQPSYGGAAHVYVSRQDLVGAFNLVINAGTGTINGSTITGAGVVAQTVASTLTADNSVPATVHLVQSPSTAGFWTIEGLSVGFV